MNPLGRRRGGRPASVRWGPRSCWPAADGATNKQRRGLRVDPATVKQNGAAGSPRSVAWGA